MFKVYIYFFIWIFPMNSGTYEINGLDSIRAYTSQSIEFHAA